MIVGVEGYQRLVVRKIYPETSLSRLVTDAYIKKQPPELLCRKSCSESFYRKTTVLELLFDKEHLFCIFM